MSYIDKSLLSSERVLYRTQAHWIVFMPALIWTVMALFFLSLTYNPVISMVGYLFCLAAIPAWIQAVIWFNVTEFGVTDQRVIIKVGFISRLTLETLLQKIESIQVSQGILGRLLNYGTVTVCGTGGTRDVFKNVDDPLAFRRAVQTQLAKVQ